jgi:hypothetical protein
MCYAAPSASSGQTLKGPLFHGIIGGIARRNENAVADRWNRLV